MNGSQGCYKRMVIYTYRLPKKAAEVGGFLILARKKLPWTYGTVSVVGTQLL
jgi:hypothetical protein